MGQFGQQAADQIQFSIHVNLHMYRKMNFLYMFELFIFTRLGEKLARKPPALYVKSLAH